MKPALRDQDTSHNQTIPEPSPSETTSLAESKSDKQIPMLDGVRAIACLGVISMHLSFHAGKQYIWKPLHGVHDVLGLLAYFAATLSYAGYSGVILFFLLSSFLLFLPYAKALLFESPWPGLRRFYLRRIFRILPGYYAAIFLMILFFHPEFLHSGHWHDLWLFLTFRIGSQLSGQLNGPFWTLPIEFQFYLLLPIIAWLFSLIVRRGTLHQRLFKLTLCLLVMIAWGLVTRYWAMYIAPTPKLDFLIPHAVSMTLVPLIYGDAGQSINEGKYFEVFAIGMLIGMVYTYTRYAASAEPWRIRMGRLSPLMFTTGLALLSFLSFWYFYINFYIAERTDQSFFPTHPKVHVLLTSITSMVLRHWAEWHTLAYALGYGFCMVALLYGSTKFKRLFESSVLRWVASISFSLYMWHFNLMSLFVTVPLVNLRRQGWSPLVQYGAFWCWTLVVILPISVMLYRWIEQSGMRLGERLVRKLER